MLNISIKFLVRANTEIFTLISPDYFPLEAMAEFTNISMHFCLGPKWMNQNEVPGSILKA